MVIRVPIAGEERENPKTEGRDLKEDGRQHPTPNIQHRTSNGLHSCKHWMLDVGSWMLDVIRIHEIGNLIVSDKRKGRPERPAVNPKRLLRPSRFGNRSEEHTSELQS